MNLIRLSIVFTIHQSKYVFNLKLDLQFFCDKFVIVYLFFFFFFFFCEGDLLFLLQQICIEISVITHLF